MKVFYLQCAKYLFQEQGRETILTKKQDLPHEPGDLVIEEEWDVGYTGRATEPQEIDNVIASSVTDYCVLVLKKPKSPKSTCV